MFRKNTAGQFIHFQGVDSSTGGIKSGVTWTVRRCIDGTFAAATGTVTEDGTTGWYKFAMSQADTNGNNIGFNFTGTGAVPQTVNIVTTACDPTSTAFGLSLAKTTNITGFNDIAATAVVSGGAITTSGGAVSTVTNTTQLNGAATVVLTDASSDAVIADAVWNAATVTYGAAGSYGLLVETNLDAAVSTRLSSAGYTAPDNAGIAAILDDTGTSGVVVAAGSKTGYSLTAGTGLGNQTADITGNLSGSVGSVTAAVTVGTISANVITASALAADAANEIRDAVWAKAMTELAAVPGVTGTTLEALEWVFLLSRNKITQTATTQSLRNDADLATIAASTVSDDGATFVRGEFA